MISAVGAVERDWTGADGGVAGISTVRSIVGIGIAGTTTVGADEDGECAGSVISSGANSSAGADAPSGIGLAGSGEAVGVGGTADSIAGVDIGVGAAAGPTDSRLFSCA